MVEGEETLKTCSICDQQVPESKFRLHEIGCARSNYRCRECGVAVAKDEKEEHEAEAHVKVISFLSELKFRLNAPTALTKMLRPNLKATLPSAR
jgi:hypothetical protein